MLIPTSRKSMNERIITGVPSFSRTRVPSPNKTGGGSPSPYPTLSCLGTMRSCDRTERISKQSSYCISSSPNMTKMNFTESSTPTNSVRGENFFALPQKDDPKSEYTQCTKSNSSLGTYTDSRQKYPQRQKVNRASIYSTPHTFLLTKFEKYPPPSFPHHDKTFKRTRNPQGVRYRLENSCGSREMAQYPESITPGDPSHE